MVDLVMLDLDKNKPIEPKHDCCNCDNINRLFDGRSTCGAFIDWGGVEGFFDRDYEKTRKEGHGFFEDDIVVKINTLVDDAHFVLRNTYNIVEHKDMSTVRKSNFNNSMRWHLCGGETNLQGNHNGIKKEIDLFWFNITNESKEKRIITKIVIYLHNLHLAYQFTYFNELWDISQICGLKNESVFDDDNIFNFTHNFFLNNGVKIEELFGIKLNDDLLNYLNEENSDA
jgi:hypothetical protein